MTIPLNKSAAPKTFTHESYRVAWICHLRDDLNMSLRMLDEKHEDLPQREQDTNIYILGSINGHNIVIAGPSHVRVCHTIPRHLTTHLRMAFPNVKCAMLVGTGGGVEVTTDLGPICVGHVVVSAPTKNHSGAIKLSYPRKPSAQSSTQYTGFLTPVIALLSFQSNLLAQPRLQHTGFLKPAIALLRASEDLWMREISRQRRRERYGGWLEEISSRYSSLRSSSAEYDSLSSPGRLHTPTSEGSGHGSGGYDPSQRIERPTQGESIVVHRGTIASLDVAFEEGQPWGVVAPEHGVLCFDNAAFEMPEDFPCIVIRGITNYWVTDKYDSCHRYAMKSAAAYARQLLLHLSVEDISEIQELEEDEVRSGAMSIPSTGSTLSPPSMQSDNSTFDYTQDDQLTESGQSRFDSTIESSSNSPFAETTKFRNVDAGVPVALASTGMDYSWSSLWLLLGNVFFPPAAGYHRIPYKCGCGETSYIDVKELSDGGIRRFRQRLLRSIAAVKAHSSNTSAPTPRPPPQAHLNSSSGSKMPLLSPIPSQAGHRQHSGPSQSTLSDRAQASGTWPRDPHSQFLLLCISRNNSTTLVQIEVGSLTNDQYLFQQVYAEYKRVRDEHKFRVSRIVPKRIRKFSSGLSALLPAHTTTSTLLSLRFLTRRMIPELNIFKVSSGDFVRFSLVPIGMSSCPRWFKRGEVPPETEVQAGRYLYEPVPMEDVEIFDIPLNHLLKPGSHTDNFWKATFPKKIKDPLIRLPGNNGQVVGWGIRVNESLNWLVVLPLILCILFSTGVIVITYAVITSDSSSAFGLGSFLLAMFTVYITYQYFVWKEQVA